MINNEHQLLAVGGHAFERESLATLCRFWARSGRPAQEENLHRLTEKNGLKADIRLIYSQDRVNGWKWPKAEVVPSVSWKHPLNFNLPYTANSVWLHKRWCCLMTIREKLKKQMFIARAAAFGFWLLFAVGIVFEQSGPYEVLPFLGFVGAVLYILFFVKCPRCGARLGQAMSYLSKPNFCPGCGVSFDSSE